MADRRIPGPPHVVERARAEAFKEIIEELARRDPELVAEVIETVRED